MLKKKIWIPLIVLIGITGGFLFYQHHTAPLEPIKVYPTDIDTGDTPQTSQEPPASTTPVETAPHGHYHEDGTYHAEPHVTRPPVSPEKPGPIRLPIPSGIVHDWTAMSPDELAAAIEAIEKRHVAAPDGYYYKRISGGPPLLDENGYPILHKIGEPEFKVVKQIGFAPTRAEYAHYQQVTQELAEAIAIGNTSEVERIQRELQHMRETFLGEIPTITYGFQTNDPNADIEALHKDAVSKATRLRYEEYRKSGFEYLIPTEYQ